MITSHPCDCRTCSGEPISPTGSGSGRTGSRSPRMRRCMTRMAAWYIPGHRVFTRCRSGPAGVSLRRWDGSGTSARRMAGIPARCLRYGLEGTTVFENEVLTRCAIGGTGIALGLIGVLAHLPFIFLILPVAVVFLGIVADPEETHAVWYGMLNTLGIFDGAALAPAERVKYCLLYTSPSPRDG